MKIGPNLVVTVDFTMHDEDNDILESSEESGPLVYLHGAGELPPGLESELEGKSAGAEIDVTLAPDEAYGEYDDELVETIPRSQFAQFGELSVGDSFTVDEDDEERVVTVVEMDDDHVVVDGNNPYAGEVVRFVVKVLGVREATPEEIEHGHVHMGDEHDHGDDHDRARDHG